MKDIEHKVGTAKWIVFVAAQVLFSIMVLNPIFGTEQSMARLLLSGLSSAPMYICISNKANRLLWQVRDFSKSEFERGRRTKENWSELNQRQR